MELFCHHFELRARSRDEDEFVWHPATRVCSSFCLVYRAFLFNLGGRPRCVAARIRLRTPFYSHSFALPCSVWVLCEQGPLETLWKADATSNIPMTKWSHSLSRCAARPLGMPWRVSGRGSLRAESQRSGCPAPSVQLQPRPARGRPQSQRPRDVAAAPSVGVWRSRRPGHLRLAPSRLPNTRHRPSADALHATSLSACVCRHALAEPRNDRSSSSLRFHVRPQTCTLHCFSSVPEREPCKVLACKPRLAQIGPQSGRSRPSLETNGPSSTFGRNWVEVGKASAQVVQIMASRTAMIWARTGSRKPALTVRKAACG